MVKHHGKSGLRLAFSAHPSSSSSSNEGENHQVNVFVGDSIHEFKSKLSQACDKEARFWALNHKSISQKYENVTIGHNHLVMVFVPSAKVQQLYEQNLQGGTEYKHAYQMALNDPSSWQPLDPTRTFAQYPQFNFGRDRGAGQLLRVIEATERYKIENIRYKEFARELNIQHFPDMDTEEMCFGWAKYTHRFDGDSCEWRPAFVSTSGDSDAAGSNYNVEWVFKPVPSDGDAVEGDVDDTLEMDKFDVLLAPRCAHIDHVVHPAHKDLLGQTMGLRQLGKSDWEIEAMLNKLLDDRWAQQHSSESPEAGSPPPRITVDIIRTYMMQRDAKDR